MSQSPPRPARRGGILAPALALALLAAGPVPAAAGERSLEEKILDSKYTLGDYAVYLGWHDPWDWQFDEHGSFALPVGFKVRFLWTDRFRIEGDVSYYRRSSTPDVLVSIYSAPNFDALLIGGSIQAVLRRSGVLRPYVGAGPVIASLGDDFLAFRPEVREVDPTNPDQFALATWSRLDIGFQALVGVDFFLNHRVSPFVEARYMRGELDLDGGDVTIGNIPFDPADLQTIPETPDGFGRPHASHYDWSGPVAVAGLKVRF